MTPRFIKYDFIIINVKHIKNINLHPTQCEFNIEHADKVTKVEVGERNVELKRKVWEYANKCLCEFLSELDSEKTSFSSMFDFNQVFEQAKIKFLEEAEEKEFEALL